MCLFNSVGSGPFDSVTDINPFRYSHMLSVSCEFLLKHVYDIMHASKCIHQFKDNACRGAEECDVIASLIPSFRRIIEEGEMES